jgi:hypothetical protein
MLELFAAPSNRSSCCRGIRERLDSTRDLVFSEQLMEIRLVLSGKCIWSVMRELPSLAFV